jgi:hypothetical protein
MSYWCARYFAPATVPGGAPERVVCFEALEDQERGWIGSSRYWLLALPEVTNQKPHRGWHMSLSCWPAGGPVAPLGAVAGGAELGCHGLV